MELKFDPMNGFDYCITLNAEDFGSKDFVCEGSQVVKIINVLWSFLSEHQWFIVNVDYNTSPKKKLENFDRESDSPFLVGSTDKFVEYVNSVEQFLDGTFIAIPQEFFNTFNWQNFKTLNSLAQECHLESHADVEIQPFDTSYFLLYTNRKEIVRQLKTGFPNAVITAKLED